MALEITDSSIKNVLSENNIVVVDFWAPWCGPCKMLGPIIDELAENNKDIIIGKLNVDENSKTSVEYGIRGIPTIIFFKDGVEVDKIVGVTSKSGFQQIIDKLKA